MRELTGKEIEKRAIMEVINYFESLIEAVMERSVIELHELNKIRQIQGLNSKTRIDREGVRRAIKVINSEYYTITSKKRTGGVIKKEKESCEKHSQIRDVLTEVT
jgi:hypothetical protein